MACAAQGNLKGPGSDRIACWCCAQVTQLMFGQVETGNILLSERCTLSAMREGHILYIEQKTTNDQTVKNQENLDKKSGP